MVIGTGKTRNRNGFKRERLRIGTARNAKG